MDLSLVLQLGLAAFAATEALKTIVGLLQRAVEGIVKLATAGVVVALLLTFGEGDPVGALAALGVAMVAHRLHRLLGAQGDAQRVSMISGARRIR